MTTEEYAAEIEGKRPTIIRSLLRFVTSEDAEDILQDAIVHALACAHNNEVLDISPAYTWAAAHWKARSHRARVKEFVRDKYAQRVDANPDTTDIGWLIPRVSGRQTRVLFLLHFGHSEREIASLIGFSASTVHNDRNAIKRAYREMTDDRGKE